MGELIERRLGRRAALRGLVGAGAVAALAHELLGSSALAQPTGPSTLTFKEVAHGLDKTQHVPEGYEAQVLIRWGDPVVAGAPAFDPNNLTAAAQEKQFGYNCDFIGLHPLPAGSTTGDRFLMVVNHEYTDPGLMFAGLGSGRNVNLKASKPQVEVELAAHGGAVVEIARDGGTWKVVDSKYARRISANTPFDVSGPAAGHDKLKTSADPTGRKVVRHAEQLRRRLDAVGHLADGRGELQRLLRRRCREDARCQGLQALRRVEGHLVCLVPAHRPLQCREGAERAQPLRLGRRDRSLRSRLDADQAHRARPLQARGLHLRASPRTAAWCSTAATTSASTMSTSSSPRGRGTPTTAPPTRT